MITSDFIPWIGCRFRFWLCGSVEIWRLVMFSGAVHLQHWRFSRVQRVQGLWAEWIFFQLRSFKSAQSRRHNEKWKKSSWREVPLNYCHVETAKLILYFWVKKRVTLSPSIQSEWHQQVKSLIRPIRLWGLCVQSLLQYSHLTLYLTRISHCTVILQF